MNNVAGRAAPLTDTEPITVICFACFPPRLRQIKFLCKFFHSSPPLPPLALHVPLWRRSPKKRTVTTTATALLQFFIVHSITDNHAPLLARYKAILFAPRRRRIYEAHVRRHTISGLPLTSDKRCLYPPGIPKRSAERGS